RDHSPPAVRASRPRSTNASVPSGVTSVSLRREYLGVPSTCPIQVLARERKDDGDGGQRGSGAVLGTRQDGTPPVFRRPQGDRDLGGRVVYRSAAHGAPIQGSAACRGRQRRRVGRPGAAARGGGRGPDAGQRTGRQRSGGPVDGQPAGRRTGRAR